MDTDAWLRLAGVVAPVLAALGTIIGYLALRRKNNAEGDGIIVNSAKGAVELMQGLMERLEHRITELEGQLAAEHEARLRDAENCDERLRAMAADYKERLDKLDAQARIWVQESCDRTTEIERKATENRAFMEARLDAERCARSNLQAQLDAIVQAAEADVRFRPTPEHIRLIVDAYVQED